MRRAERAPSGEHLLRRVHDAQVLVDARDGQQALHLLGAPRHGELLPALLRAAAGGEDQAQARRVDELQSVEIDHERRAGSDLAAVDLALELRRAGEIELALQAHDDHVALAARVDLEVLLNRHRPMLPHALSTPAACRPASITPSVYSSKVCPISSSYLVSVMSTGSTTPSSVPGVPSGVAMPSRSISRAGWWPASATVSRAKG